MRIAMKRTIQWILALALTLVSSSALALDVVATVPDLASIAAEVGGEKVEVTALASPNEDPHYVDPRPNLILKLNKADVLVSVGLELEDAWLTPLVTQSRNAKLAPGGEGRLVAAEHVELLEVPTTKVDRAEGDVHPGGNPHFYFDPRRAIRIAIALRDQFKRLDPENAETYDANTRKFVRQAQKLVIAQRNRFKDLPAERRRVVTYHKSLAYLLDWLALEAVETVEPKPGIPPNPAHVAKVLKSMKANKMKVIIQEEFYPKKTSDTLAKLTKGEVVVVEAGTRLEKGESYVEHIHKVTEGIYAALTR